MGNAASLKRLTKDQARQAAGSEWDEALFDSLANESKDGKVSKSKLLHAKKHVERGQEPKNLAAVDDKTRAQRARDISSRITVKDQVPVNIHFGSVIATDGTRQLLNDIGMENILGMTNRFYEKAFQDQHLDKFIRSHQDPHGERLGTWIMEKMDDTNPVWSSQRPPNARTQAHRDAWTSPKRESSKVGRRFKLDDCRVWMRLMFWAAREQGLDAHPQFFDWYVRFIGRFIGIYEISAPPYAQQEALWSADPRNVQAYLNQGNIMSDVIGVR